METDVFGKREAWELTGCGTFELGDIRAWGHSDLESNGFGPSLGMLYLVNLIFYYDMQSLGIWLANLCLVTLDYK